MLPEIFLRPSRLKKEGENSSWQATIAAWWEQREARPSLRYLHAPTRGQMCVGSEHKECLKVKKSDSGKVLRTQ